MTIETKSIRESSVTATKAQVRDFRQTVLNYIEIGIDSRMSQAKVDIQESLKVPLVTNHVVNSNESEVEGFQRVYTFALPNSITYRSIQRVGEKDNPYDMFIDVIWDENLTSKEEIEN